MKTHIVCTSMHIKKTKLKIISKNMHVSGKKAQVLTGPEIGKGSPKL